MSSRIGFFVFAGLILGTFVGSYLVGSPAIGSVVCALLGLVIAVLLDLRDKKRGSAD